MIELKSIASNIFSTIDFIEWSYKNLLIETSGKWIPFSFTGHEPLKELYEQSNHPYMSVKKAAQLGVSTYSASRAIYLGQQYGMSSIYYFPTDVEVDDFVDGKFTPIIQQSQNLSRLQRPTDPNNKGLKVFTGFRVYFRGVYTKRRVKGITGDFVIKDEVDEANVENLKFADDRTLHSKFGYIMELSQPSISDYGIDASFQLGDQRYWGIKCGCGKWNFPDKTFPDCLIKNKHGLVYIGCIKCRKPINIAEGQWVADYPERTNTRRSYQLSHLIFDLIKPEKIYEKYNSLRAIEEKKNFNISMLGKTYDSPNNKPITLTVLNQVQRDYKLTNQYNASYFGMDVGDICHLVFGHYYQGRLRVHWMEELPADDEKRIINTIRKHGLLHGVIDAMPYKTLAKNIAKTFRGKIYLHYLRERLNNPFNVGIEGEDEKSLPKITVNRTESIDETVDQLLSGRIELPSLKKANGVALENYTKFRTQLTFLIKEQVVRSNGRVEYEYKHTVPNHYGMALNSMRIASELAQYNIVTGIDPVYMDLK
jgi:hypothetical protein